MPSQADQLFAAGRYLEALSLYAEALKSHGDDPDLLARCGTCLLQVGEFQRAGLLLEQALKQRPDQGEALQTLAILLAQQGQLDDALTRFQQLYRLTPGNASILNNIAIVLNRLERYADAVPWFERALNAAPELADAWIGLAAARHELGDQAAADAAVDRAIAADPAAPLPRLMRAMFTLPIVAETPAQSTMVPLSFVQATADLDCWASEHSGHLMALGERVGDRQPFLLAYRPGNLCSALSAYGDLMGRAARAYWHGRMPMPPHPKGSRIRLGIISAHIHGHSVWYVIIKGLLRHLLRTQFEISIYYTGGRHDLETAWAEERVDRFVAGPKGHAEWLSLIREEGLDVLFLPEVGMDPLSCKFGALRLAPLQVASWGHPVTTGLPEIDLFVSGELLESRDSINHYRERLIRLPGTGVCTEWTEVPSNALPELPLVARAESELRLLIAQQPSKFDPGDDLLIAQVVRACAPCKLYYPRRKQLPWASDLVRARLHRALRAEGLDPDSVLVECPWLPRAGFLSLLESVDLYLDLPAFSGYTTAWQALHCGLPIIALEGAYLRQRLAAGLLRQVGLTDTIAHTAKDYVRIATDLARECRNSNARERRRAAIRAAAPAADHNVAAVRAFECALIDHLAERGRRYAFSPPGVESTPDSIKAEVGASDPAGRKEAVYPWQKLNSGLHSQTLNPEYGPTGQSEMIASAPQHLTEERSFRTALAAGNLQSIQKGTHRYRWKGLPMWKNPFDFALYWLLVWQAQPRTIIELGSKFGGSALWFADMLRLYGIDGRVVSVDIEPVRGVSAPCVDFLTGDVACLEKTLTPDYLAALPRPWLMIEDSSHIYEHTLAVLRFFHPLLRKGEFLIIEDGNLDDLGLSAQFNGGPNRAVREFMTEHHASYALMTELCDFWGENVTWNPNGYWRKLTDS